jgi:hypothetical protein
MVMERQREMPGKQRVIPVQVRMDDWRKITNAAKILGVSKNVLGRYAMRKTLARIEVALRDPMELELFLSDLHEIRDMGPGVMPMGDIPGVVVLEEFGKKKTKKVPSGTRVGVRIDESKHMLVGHVLSRSGDTTAVAVAGTVMRVASSVVTISTKH